MSDMDSAPVVQMYSLKFGKVICPLNHFVWVFSAWRAPYSSECVPNIYI